MVIAFNLYLTPVIKFVSDPSYLGLEPDALVNHLRGHKGRPHPIALGPVDKIREMAKQLSQRFIKGMCESRVLYST